MNRHHPRRRRSASSSPAAAEAAKSAEFPAGSVWLWGRHAVLAALRNPARRPLRLIAVDERDDALAAAAAARGTGIHHLARQEFERLLPSGAVHQGLALLAEPLPGLSIEAFLDATAGNDGAVVVALDRVSDPHNVGAVLRSAAAFGAAAVIVPERNAPEVTGTLAKAASGALELVPLIRVVNLSRALETLKEARFWCVGLAADGDRTLAALAPSGRSCLVLGSEGEGMRRLTREACDFTVRLPTSGPVASLNVSNAAAIALYELVRNRE